VAHLESGRDKHVSANTYQRLRTACSSLHLTTTIHIPHPKQSVSVLSLILTESAHTLTRCRPVKNCNSILFLFRHRTRLSIMSLNWTERSVAVFVIVCQSGVDLIPILSLPSILSSTPWNIALKYPKRMPLSAVFLS
jgi:hypothetical protein